MMASRYLFDYDFDPVYTMPVDEEDHWDPYCLNRNYGGPRRMPSSSTQASSVSKTCEAKKEITILLLGETGVGKSTFINAFVNYLAHDELELAKGNVACLIPSKFAICDEKTYDIKTVSLGELDQNEANTPGKSSTLHCRCYSFTEGNMTFKLIDAPGIGDTRGVQTDGTNMRNLLNFISNYKELHAICILLKPNNARVDVVFKYCILQLLTHLDKSASRNIMFVFTNARGTFYRPGDTAVSLKVILESIKKKPPYVHIKFEKDNVYCLDNEAFRFLVATSPPNNIRFRPDEIENFKGSWRTSVAECRRLLENVIKIAPHQVQDTISVNRARSSIMLLTEPLGQIAKYISSNMKACENHKQKISEWQGDIEELKEQLYIPSVDIISIPLNYPRTVCSDPKCCEKIDVDGCIKIHYKTVCHDPCYLESSDGNVIGNKGLLDCDAFNIYKPAEAFRWKKADETHFRPDMDMTTNEYGEIYCASMNRIKKDRCNNCRHSYAVHLHIMSETQIKHRKVRDEIKSERIADRHEALRYQRKKLKQLEKRIRQLETERNIVTKYTAKFACFLANNALTPFNDAFEDYLLHLIENEKSGIDSDDRQTLVSLEKMLFDHKRQKEILMNLLEGNTHFEDVSSSSVEEAIQDLCKLKLCGSKIKMDFELQRKTRDTAHCHHKEVVCEMPEVKSTWWRKLLFK